ncbi:MAG: ABC transporter ATP-binding protein [Gemmatimonadetes bacterium]|nr:ABC transporter ATP-binding protein [Gemmatimonadota bacterium]
MPESILSVRNFCVDYATDSGPVRAIDNVNLDLYRGEILGLAGESGSGKTTLAQALLRILPPPAVITGGEVHFEGHDLLKLSESELRKLRWKRMAMVFQSAMDALNPVITIGEQIVDTLVAHDAGTPKACRERAAELLEMVSIPADRLDSFAHQLSGGMRQRVGIALALALEPSLLILDEPTTALDVIVEREILDQIKELQKTLGFTVLFITHDLARMLEFSDRVAIFYAARLAEVGPAEELRHRARHPYTRGLLGAFPQVRASADEPKSIPGAPPSLTTPPPGCRFHPRCELADARCQAEVPELRQFGTGHFASCHHAD